MTWGDERRAQSCEVWARIMRRMQREPGDGYDRAATTLERRARRLCGEKIECQR